MVADEEGSALAAALERERTRLVRLCARLSGDSQDAEDLAQETLAEAWRLRRRLQSVDGLAPWLSAIARNVCLRWGRRHARDVAHGATASDEGGARTDGGLNALPAPDDEPALVLEREELVWLLDRALELVPESSRLALVASVVHDLPQAELAARLGLSEGTLRVRLHRGKLALRRALTTALREDAVALGLAVPEGSAWQMTRIWCPFCGSHRLHARIDRDTGELAFHCEGECARAMSVVGLAQNPALVTELTSAKSILARHCVQVGHSYRQILARGRAGCPSCGRELRAQRWRPEQSAPGPLSMHGFYMLCPSCGAGDSATLWHLALDTDAAQRFWRRHPHMHALPVCEMSFAGRPALLTGFQSLDTAARFDMICDRDTYEVLELSGSDGAKNR